MTTHADRPLFTPGPLTTSLSVKEAMLRDLGSREREFLDAVADVRRGVLEIAHAHASEWTCVPMQGSGTFAIEAVISSAVPRDGHLVVAVNGAYGRRMADIGRRHGIYTSVIDFPETERLDPQRIGAELARSQGGKTLLAFVHCETTTGLVNPIEKIAAVAHNLNVRCFIDSMSGFGALPLDCSAMPGADWIVSSSNKCIEGVPGLGLIIGRTSRVADCEGRARTVSLDVWAQWKGLEADGQFRFTPPTHVILALQKAIRELADEGGPPARLARYARLQQIIVQGLRGAGYRTLLPDDMLSPIITSFLYPESKAFNFTTFSADLARAGFIIYPGKVSNAPCFRVGSIGRLREADARGLVRTIASMSH